MTKRPADNQRWWADRRSSSPRVLASSTRGAVMLALTVLVLAGCSAAGEMPVAATPPASLPTSDESTPVNRGPAAASSSIAEAVPPSTVPQLSENPPATGVPFSGTGDQSAAVPSGPLQPSAFSAAVSAIDQATASRMGTSWRAGCPVPLADLRLITLTYRGFDGADHAGDLVVAATVADDVVAIFRQLYGDGYPIASLRLVDDFGGDDDASMAANNSSAFNCRPVTGGSGFSEHSFGTAIDLNPVQNPYVSRAVVAPDAGRDYLDRHPAPGVILPGDAVVTAFADHGWRWGGEWTAPVDYQHFSVSGR